MATLEPQDGLKDEESGEAKTYEAAMEGIGTYVWSLSQKKFVKSAYQMKGPEGKKFLRGKSEEVEPEQDGTKEVQQGQAQQGTQEEEPG